MMPIRIMIVSFLFQTALWAQVEHTEQLPATRGKSAGVQSEFDRAIGFMDAGQMKVIGVENFGLLSGWDPDNTPSWYPGAKHGAWGEIRWIAPILCMPPGPWGAQDVGQGTALPEDRSDQYNSIESFSAIHLHAGDNFGYTDWEAKDGAAEHYHGQVTQDAIPMIAVSDQPETWPQGYWDEQDNWVYTPGEYHWPGTWALDPDSTSPTWNQEMEGEFVSSKDIYFIADDKYNGIRPGANTARYGYPVGVDMEVSGYSYSATPYEDVTFFNINFIYRTVEQLTDPNSRYYDPDRRIYDGRIDSVYFAFFVDPDLPGAFTANNQQTHPWAEDDYALVYDWDHDGTIDVCLMFDKQDWNADETRPENNGPVSAYGINFFRTPRVNPSDTLSPEIGITGFHWFDQDEAMRNLPVDASLEKKFWAISAGRPDLLDSADAEDWFHGNNPQMDDVELLRDFQEQFSPGSRPDIQFWFSSGPFSMAPGDTIPIHIGIVGGAAEPGGYDEQGFPLNTDPEVRFADVFENLERANELYEHNFQGSEPPAPPTLYAAGTVVYNRDSVPTVYGEDGEVTLYWSNRSEASRDVISGRYDFEGYRIYRTMVDPRSTSFPDWGEEIYNYDGEILGYQPVAQYDLNDEWEGADPFAPWFDLGSNSGLQYTWTDHDVVNGVHYRYTITAYDMPDTTQSLAAMETTRGYDPRKPFVVDVIPGVQPPGYQTARSDSLVTHVAGHATGMVQTEVLNSMAVTGHPYRITFSDTTLVGGELLVSVQDTITGQWLEQNLNALWNRDESALVSPRPIVDGVGVTLINDNHIELRDQGWMFVSGDTSDYQFGPLYVTQDSLFMPADYQVVFGDSSSKLDLNPASRYVPFQVFNITQDPERLEPLALYVRNPGVEWRSGDYIYLLEPDVDHRTWQFAITWQEDSTPPVAGDVYQYTTRKPFSVNDVYIFDTTADEVGAGTHLDEIRVVPNPYIVSSGTEQYARSDFVTHDLRFTHVPPRCTIRIYTMAGRKIRTLYHNSHTIGEVHWDLLTSENLEVAYGVYVYTVETPEGGHHTDKFAIIW